MSINVFKYFMRFLLNLKCVLRGYIIFCTDYYGNIAIINLKIKYFKKLLITFFIKMATD